MVINVYPSWEIELEDQLNRSLVVNGRRLKNYHVGGPRAAKVELPHFKDLK